MFRDEQIAYGLLCLAAVGFYAIVIPAQIQEPELATVSPRLIPQVCTALIFALSLYKLLATLRLGNGQFLISRSNYIYLAATLGILTLTCLAMYWIGFWVSIVVAVAVLQLLAGQRNLVVLPIYAVALVATSWFLMDLSGLYILVP